MTMMLGTEAENEKLFESVSGREVRALLRNGRCKRPGAKSLHGAVIGEKLDPSPLIPLPIGWGEGDSRSKQGFSDSELEYPRPIRWGEGLRERGQFLRDLVSHRA